MIYYTNSCNHKIGPFQIDSQSIMQRLELLKKRRELLLQEQEFLVQKLELENLNLEKKSLIQRIETQDLQNVFWTLAIVGAGLDGIAAVTVINNNRKSNENNNNNNNNNKKN